MARQKTSYTPIYIFFYLLLSVLSCYFDPIYTDRNVDEETAIEFYIENGADIEIIEVIISGAGIDSVHFFQPLNDQKISCSVMPQSNMLFTLNGYLNNILRYSINFSASIGEEDTSFSLKMEEINVNILDMPKNCMLELLENNVVQFNWDASDGATGYTVFRKKEIDGAIDMLQTTNTPSFLDSSCTAERTYYYAVSAYNDSAVSDTSGYLDIYIPPITTIPDIPTEVATKDITATSVLLTWKSVPGAAKYNIYRILGSGTPDTKIGSIDAIEYNDTALTPQTQYTYSITAENSAGESGKSSPVTVTTLLPMPAVPSNVSTTVLSDKSIRINWDAVAYTEIYEVHRSLSENGTYTLDGTSASNSYISANLTPETTYWYKVTAKNVVGISDYSNAVSATTLEEIVIPPDVPTQVTAHALSPSQIRLQWQRVSNASSYRIYRSNSSTGTFIEIGTTSDSLYTDTGLVENTEYFYAVSAVNSGGESDKSPTVSARTMIFITVPTGLTGTAQSSSSILLTWNSVVGATAYRIFRASSLSGTYTEIDSTNTTTYTDNVLQPNTTYYYKISARGASGESDQTDAVAVTTTMEVPQTPQGLTATALSATSIRIVFSAVTNATTYTIYTSSTASGTFTKVTDVSSNQYTHNNLTANTTYYYKVSASNSGGESALSNAVSATTLGTPPATPTNVRANAASSSEIQVTYNAVSDATQYMIYHATSANGQYTKIDSLTGTTYSHQGLTAGSTHYYKVSATNANGESDLSNAVNATTLSGAKVAYISNCRGCGRCPGRCDVGAIKRSGSVYVVDPSLCTGCGDCISACPYGYIKLIDAFEAIKEWVGNAIHGVTKGK